MQRSAQNPKIHTNRRPYIIAGVVILAVMAGGFGTWAAVAPLSGALVAPGIVTVETNRKTVQHLEGGIVSELRVREGDLVQRDDVLIRLDKTQVKTQLAVTDGRLDVLKAREARLTAERELADSVTFPDAMQRRQATSQLAEIMRGQSDLFLARRAAYLGSASLLKQRIAQLQDEIQGLEAQRNSKAGQIRIIRKELTDLRMLLEKGLVPRPRVLALEREMERLTGERGQNIAEIARAQKAIGETELDIVQLQKTRREIVETELRDVQAEIYDLVERRVVFEDQHQRTDVRAPQSGQVVGLSVHTTGAVITPGQKLMDIVPREDRLIVEARLRPEDVDKVLSGSVATVRFSAFDRDTTPELTGEVAIVSGDRLTDPATQETYYAVRVTIPSGEIERLKGLQLRAGMPAEVFIQTGKRTALSYLVKPLADALRRSLLDA